LSNSRSQKVTLPVTESTSIRLMLLIQHLEKAARVCDLENSLGMMEKKITTMFRSYSRKPLDIMRIVKFIQSLAK